MEENEYSLEEIIKNDIKCQIRYNVKKAMNHFGIEGTLEKIETLYVLMPVLQQKMLDEYHSILKGE